MDPWLSFVHLHPGFIVLIWLPGSMTCFGGLVHEFVGLRTKFVVLHGHLPVFWFHITHYFPGSPIYWHCRWWYVCQVFYVGTEKRADIPLLTVTLKRRCTKLTHWRCLCFFQRNGFIFKVILVSSLPSGNIQYKAAGNEKTKEHLYFFHNKLTLSMYLSCTWW